MFDVAPSELLVVAVIALVVIGPKDMPLALRTAGKWIGKARRMSNHFRAGVEAMIREAELAEIEKEWRERNARIMAEHPDGAALDKTADETVSDTDAPVMEPLDRHVEADAAAEAAIARARPVIPLARPEGEGEPELPLSDTPAEKR